MCLCHHSSSSKIWHRCKKRPCMYNGRLLKRWWSMIGHNAGSNPLLAQDHGNGDSARKCGQIIRHTVVTACDADSFWLTLPWFNRKSYQTLAITVPTDVFSANMAGRQICHSKHNSFGRWNQTPESRVIIIQSQAPMEHRSTKQTIMLLHTMMNYKRIKYNYCYVYKSNKK